MSVLSGAEIIQDLAREVGRFLSVEIAARVEGSLEICVSCEPGGVLVVGAGWPSEPRAGARVDFASPLNGWVSVGGGEQGAVIASVLAAMLQRCFEPGHLHLQVQVVERFGRIGWWRWDLGSNRFDLSAGAAALFPGVRFVPGGPAEVFLDSVVPDDRELARAALRRVHNTGIILPMVFRVHGEFSGEILHIRMEGEALRSESGEVTAVVGVFRDVTEVREAEARVAEKDKALQDKRIAMRELLGQVQRSQDAVREAVLHNIEETIRPVLRRMKSPAQLRQLSSECREAFEHIERTLDAICDDFLRDIQKTDGGLTPMETRVCHLARAGYAVKEIAEMLTLSPPTVKSHIRSIRRKLNIADTRISLGSYLRTLKTDS